MANRSILLSEYLLQIKAIQLNVQNPFTWASGWKSPVYCDNRILLSFPKVRDFVKTELVRIVKEQFPNANCIAGVATAGIPHGALVADILELPMVYVRDKPKGHGMKNSIEGRLPEDARVVVIEDVVSTGKSSLKAVEDLREAGAHIEGMAAIYSYEFDLAKERFRDSNVNLFTITNYSDLITTAVNTGYVSSNYIQTLTEWRNDPSTWNEK
ncbi:MAG: orotate phosphoribosyltransferase [Chitinophagales bacterium]|nr:orotate phosphoribosyltransferase [Chitinophagales bacterium]